jgi:hypothetical protein
MAVAINAKRKTEKKKVLRKINNIYLSSFFISHAN